VAALRERARAKLNLTLEVLGRRDDGYHELRSLVAFTQLGDCLELEPGEDFGLAIEGPFGGALQGANLVAAAAEAARAKRPGIKLGQFRLFKDLPVAAGLGGGSADAAAALRLLADANPNAFNCDFLTEIAAHLGSDVAACLESRPALITGRGERVTMVHGLPACGVVLANPRLALSTASVYGAFASSPLATAPQPARAPDFAGSFPRLLDHARARGNDLEPTALRLVPAIGEVLAALRGLNGAALVRLSGSGPTCFALFATGEEARRAAATLKAAHPAWWVAATTLASVERAGTET
jgi:4-diphosphocytidyl-2-C-methyl-D-erythritol kinase